MDLLCIVVAPNMRGKGIATALLKTICSDAKICNYSYIEAYPSLGEFKELNYHGPFSMYEKLGFILQERTGEMVVRKYL